MQERARHRSKRIRHVPVVCVGGCREAGLPVDLTSRAASTRTISHFAFMNRQECGQRWDHLELVERAAELGSDAATERGAKQGQGEQA